MSPMWVNVVKVVFIGVIYLYLWYVARAVASHLKAAPSRQPQAPSSTPSDVVIVVITDQAGTTRHVEVRRPVIVGRGAVDIVIDDPFASDRHLRLDLNAGRLVVEDLGSTNGTLVNDTVIHVPTIIGRGDSVRVGTTTLELK
jgi:pSer/pThr/pTyr-binding forkhead associated (FHA) protein